MGTGGESWEHGKPDAGITDRDDHEGLHAALGVVDLEDTHTHTHKHKHKQTHTHAHTHTIAYAPALLCEKVCSLSTKTTSLLLKASILSRKP